VAVWICARAIPGNPISSETNAKEQTAQRQFMQEKRFIEKGSFRIAWTGDAAKVVPAQVVKLAPSISYRSGLHYADTTALHFRGAVRSGELWNQPVRKLIEADRTPAIRMPVLATGIDPSFHDFPQHPRGKLEELTRGAV
jgi:hypothetical protein